MSGRDPGVPLKGPKYEDLLGITCYDLQHWYSNSKGTRDIQGEIEVPGIRMKDVGETSSQTEVMAVTIVLFLGPPQNQQAGAISESSST